jgi:hypothetical protein
MILEATDEVLVLTAVTAIGGLLGVIVSLIFLAIQTRTLSRQVRAGNTLTGTQVLDHALTSLRELHLKMLEYPGMRAYFYDGKPCPGHGTDKERVVTFAELFADVLDTGIQAVRRIPENENEQWVSYCRFALDHSPALRTTVTAHINWWPRLAELC